MVQGNFGGFRFKPEGIFGSYCPHSHLLFTWNPEQPLGGGVSAMVLHFN